MNVLREIFAWLTSQSLAAYLVRGVLGIGLVTAARSSVRVSPVSATAISRFCQSWNEHCQPFSWTKPADEILGLVIVAVRIERRHLVVSRKRHRQEELRPLFADAESVRDARADDDHCHGRSVAHPDVRPLGGIRIDVTLVDVVHDVRRRRIHRSRVGRHEGRQETCGDD